MKIVTREELGLSDLVIDCLYQGGRNGNSSDDPLNLLLPVSNQGGFRIIGTKTQPRLVALTTSLDDPDWPDEIDKEAGIFTYFGDNKKPGHELHDTPRYGNLLLKHMFNSVHSEPNQRDKVPPIFVFEKARKWRDVIFLGLAVPGATNLDSNSDLIAVWKQRGGSRFQNYRAKFTILNTPIIPRSWIEEIVEGSPMGQSCPESWRSWVETGTYAPLKAPRSLQYRSRAEQLPQENRGLSIIRHIHSHFGNDAFRFEACAARIAEIMLPDIAGNLNLTRSVRDGGRDAVGQYRIGTGDSAILVDFALEAKCYAMAKSVGVKDVSRLISRLRHRQFGVLVTTSFLSNQAYQEIIEDQHPIVIICASDIANLLMGHGINSRSELELWLSNF